MSEWQPLSVRRGLREDHGPFEGVPAHITLHLVNWLEAQLDPYVTFDGAAKAVALRLGLVVKERYSEAREVVLAVQSDEDLLLDAVDMALRAGRGSGAAELEAILGLGGSVWKAEGDGESLVRRVPDAEAKAHAAATDPDDDISAELDEAWAKTYGRHPDPSDAWDHAIKAVELALWPIATPTNSKANLGTIVGELGKPDAPFALRLATSSTKSTSVEALVQMLRLMWPNPDRHGTGHRRTPDPEEAVNVVQLAITVVGWARTGALVRQPAA